MKLFFIKKSLDEIHHLLIDMNFYSCPIQKFEYLTNLKIYQLCQDKFQDENTLYQRKREFYEEYKKTSIADIYLQELKELKEYMLNSKKNELKVDM